MLRNKVRSFWILSSLFVGSLLLFGIIFVSQDLNAFLSQRTEFLRQNTVALSQLLSSSVVEQSLTIKEAGQNQPRNLKNNLLQAKADLQVQGEISFLSFHQNGLRLLASTNPKEEFGASEQLSEKAQSALYAHLPYSTGYEMKSGEFFVHTYAPYYTADGKLAGVTRVKSNESAIVYRGFGLGLIYVLSVLIAAAFSFVLSFYFARKKIQENQNYEVYLQKLQEEVSFPLLRLNKKLQIEDINFEALRLFESTKEDLLGKEIFENAIAHKLIPLEQGFSKLEQKLTEAQDFRFKAKMMNEADEALFFQVYCCYAPGLEGGALLLFKPLELQAQASSLVYIDLDDFSYYEHLHGKEESQKLIHSFERKLKNFFRSSDKITHDQKDQFILVLNQTPPKIAAKLMKDFEKDLRKADDSNLSGVFFSAGIAQQPPHEDFENCLERAKEAAEHVKKHGKAGIKSA